MSATLAAGPRSFDVEAVRRDFPILQKPLRKGMLPVYLDNGASTQKPRVVLDKERECYETYYANAYRGVHQFGERVDEEMEAARRKVQQFLGAAEPEEIVFTSGCTMGINLVANAWGRKFLRPGDEILLNEMEHHANLVPWQMIAAETGAVLRFIPLTADGRLDLSRLDEGLTDRTRLLAVTGMSNVLGTIPPIAELAARAHDRGALVLVDGAQSVPHLPTNVQSYLPPLTRGGRGGASNGSPARGTHIDFLAFSGHKMFAPTGIGILYGRRELLEAMNPFLGGGHMIARVFREHSEWNALPAKFEAGTLPIVQAIALGTAVDYVNRLGFDALHQHEQRLLRTAHERLLAVPGLTLYGPDVDHKGAICSFTMEGAHPYDLAVQLSRRGVFVRHGHHCTMPLHDRLGVPATVRASFAPYNTEAEIDALIDALHFARKRLRLE